MKKILLLAIFFWYLLLPLDTDLGWHLRYGQQIWQNQTVFKTNDLGFFLSSYQWRHSYSLYQLVTFTLFKYFSFSGLILANALLMTVVFYFLYRLYRSKSAFFLVLSSFFLIIGSQVVTNLGWRSQLFSLLGLSFIFYFILSKSKKYFFLPLIFFLWANLHGGFVLGFGLLGFNLIEKLIQNKKKGATSLTVILIVSFLATLINPFGFGLYREIIRHFWYPLNKLIAEWTAPAKLNLLTIGVSFSISFLGLLLQKRSFLSFKRNNFFLIGSYFLFFLLSLKAKRNLPFLALASVHLWAHLFRFRDKKPLLNKAVFLISSFFLILFKIPHLPNLNSDWSTICSSSFWPPPCQAAEFLKKNHKLCQNIYNTYEWGGFLVWHFPDKKFFVDGRMPAWPTAEGKSPYTLYLEILQAPPNFNQKLLDYQTDCLFIARGTFLDLELKKDPEKYPWQIFYEDRQTVIYTLKP